MWQLRVLVAYLACSSLTRRRWPTRWKGKYALAARASYGARSRPRPATAARRMKPITTAACSFRARPARPPTAFMRRIRTLGELSEIAALSDCGQEHGVAARLQWHADLSVRNRSDVSRVRSRQCQLLERSAGGGRLHLRQRLHLRR